MTNTLLLMQIQFMNKYVIPMLHDLGCTGIQFNHSPCGAESYLEWYDIHGKYQCVDTTGLSRKEILKDVADIINE